MAVNIEEMKLSVIATDIGLINRALEVLNGDYPGGSSTIPRDYESPLRDYLLNEKAKQMAKQYLERREKEHAPLLTKKRSSEERDKATEMVSVTNKNSRRWTGAQSIPTGSAQSTPTSTSSFASLTPNGKLLQIELNNLIADKESVKAMERQLARKRNIYTNTNLKDHY